MSTLIFWLETQTAIIRLLQKSACGFREYTILEFLCQVFLNFCQCSMRTMIRGNIRYKEISNSLYYTLEVISFLDAEHGRHTYERYTAEYSVLFSNRSFLREDEKKSSNFVPSRSNYFILTVLRREWKRFLFIMLMYFASFFLNYCTRKWLKSLLLRFQKICSLLTVAFFALYYFNMLENCVPGYWPYIRSLFPLFLCGRSTMRNGDVLLKSGLPSNIVVILLESFPAYLTLRDGRLDATVMPFLSRYADENYLYQNVLSMSIPTSNSFFSLFSGHTAQQRTVSTVSAFGRQYASVFSELRRGGYETVLFLPFSRAFDKLDAFMYLFDEVVDDVGESHAEQFRWTPDRLQVDAVLGRIAAPTNKTSGEHAKRLVIYSTAETHYPFTGFDTAAQYAQFETGGVGATNFKAPGATAAEASIYTTLRYLDRQLERLIRQLPNGTMVLITGDHGNGYYGASPAECSFGTIAITNAARGTLAKTVSHQEVVDELFTEGRSTQTLINDGYQSKMLVDGRLRESTWAERYQNDCSVSNMGALKAQQYRPIWAIEQMQLMFIYNVVFLLLSVIEIKRQQDLLTVKQRMIIRSCRPIHTYIHTYTLGIGFGGDCGQF